MDDNFDVNGDFNDGNNGGGYCNDGDDENIPPPEYESQHWQDLLYWHVALVGISAECSVSLEKYSLKVSVSVKVK